jgi:hypothetical protein
MSAGSMGRYPQIRRRLAEGRGVREIARALSKTPPRTRRIATCCGSNSLPKSFQTRVLPGRAVPARTAPKPGTAARTPPASKLTYTGNTGLTVVSPITGSATASNDPVRERKWTQEIARG